MKKHLIFGIVLVFLLTCFFSCKTDITEPDTLSCPDTRFIGKWECSNTGHTNYYQMYYFLDSNKINFAYLNYLTDDFGYMAKFFEWKKEGNSYFIRNWDASASWKNFDVLYISEESIQIEGKVYTKTTRTPPW